MAKINIIAAATLNNVIGRDGKIPWKQKADMQRFKQLTTGNHVIMGRKTFESIGRALPNRRNYVITKRPDWYWHLQPTDGSLLFVDDLHEAISLAENLNEVSGNDREIFIIGGAEIYKRALAEIELSHIYMTWLQTNELEGDAFMPEIPAKYDAIPYFRPTQPADADNDHAYRFEDFHPFVRGTQNK